jgi:hypothetical protein
MIPSWVTSSPFMVYPQSASLYLDAKMIISGSELRGFWRRIAKKRHKFVPDDSTGASLTEHALGSNQG